MQKQILLIFFVCISVMGMAGGKLKIPSDYNIESRFHYGFIWPHHESMRYLQRGHIPAFDLRINRTMHIENWAKLYRQPDLGIGFYHNNMQWPDVLGKINAVYGFIKIPIYRKPRFFINYSFAFGTAFMSEYFDVKDNYFNIAIGSFTNVYLNFGMEAQAAISNNLHFLLGIDLSHVSNGAIRKPNLGLNLPAINIGIKYSVNPQAINFRKKYVPDENIRKFDVLLIGSAGWKEIMPKGNTYFTSSFWVDAGYMITKKKRMGIGLDIFYDASIVRRMERKEVDESVRRNKVRQGVHISYDLIFDKIYFTIQTGYYLFVNWNDDINIYNRFGLRYHHNKFIYSLSLKTHLGRADFIEWSIGYVLFQKNYKK